MATHSANSVSTITETAPEKPADSGWPRITLVTPVRNSARYLEQTIRSVIFQGYPNLEYIIVDGGSTDGTVEIIHKYEEHLFWWVSESDNGHFDALNKGFAHSSGEILGWINGSDQLHVRSLFVVGSVFRILPDVEWITGIPTGFDEQGMTVAVERLPRWSRFRFLAGANRNIQQESTFWRRSLWERAGGYVDDSRRNASDFELWVRFFRHARLHSVDALIGGYRVHGDSLGMQDLEACHRIHDEVIRAELRNLRWGRMLRAFRAVSTAIESTPKMKWFWWQLVMRHLYFMPGPDMPPVIDYFWGQGWRMRK